MQKFPLGIFESWDGGLEEPTLHLHRIGDKRFAFVGWRPVGPPDERFGCPGTNESLI